MAPLLPLAKLAGVFAKQIAKPVSQRLVNGAQKPGRVQDSCIYVGQMLHRITMFSIQRSEQKDRFKTAFEVTSEEGHVIEKGLKVKLVLEESDRQQIKVKIDQKDRKFWIPTKIEGNKILVREDVKRISDEVALDRGATFMGEALVLGVASIVVIEEFVRYQRNEAALFEEKEEKKKLKEKKKQEECEARDREREALRADLTSLLERIDRLEAENQNLANLIEKIGPLV